MGKIMQEISLAMNDKSERLILYNLRIKDDNI